MWLHPKTPKSYYVTKDGGHQIDVLALYLLKCSPRPTVEEHFFIDGQPYEEIVSKVVILAEVAGDQLLNVRQSIIQRCGPLIITWQGLNHYRSENRFENPVTGSKIM